MVGGTAPALAALALAALAAVTPAHPGTAPVTAGTPPATKGTPSGANEPTQAALARVDRLEDLLLALTPRLDTLDASVGNLTLPDTEGRRLFAATLTVVDLDARPLPGFALADGLVQVDAWPVEGAERTVPGRDARLWRPFLDAVEYVTFAHFKLASGRFIDAAETRYAAEVRFSANARMATGHIASISGNLEIGWSRPPRRPRGDGTEWSIDAWRTRNFSVTRAAEPLFAEVLDRALPDAGALDRARRSLHEEAVRRLLIDPKSVKPHPRFQFQSLNQHPGLSVVDVDRDGLDDLYAMERMGANLLLRNRGDGTFEEIAARLGLDLADHCTSALFADFDNDGDADLFVGRSLAGSRYFVNEGGRFVDRSSDLVAAPLPALVSSISAADYDGDGLLDVYLSTYGFEEDVQEEFLPPDAVREIKRRWSAGGHMFRDRPGPPNVLLRNLGEGRFAPAPTMGLLAGWRNTFQSTWSDYDADGDMDVYLANDFAPNNLLRNDGGGRFSDVTAATGTADIGFGMGASWGDYDGDGRHDLYVSNMYSTAGRRITAQLGALGETIAPMARGNSLFRNLAHGFRRVSGVAPPALLVEKAGWAWGGQFADVDNDGHLDIHSLSGYYTAPDLPGSHPDL